MIEMKVKGIGLDPSRGNESPMVILTDAEEKRMLPIRIGPFEASAILMALENIPIERPMTHDLLKNIVESLKGRIINIMITRLQEQVFYAQISVEHADGVIEIDARPSDAIALALRAKAPILVSEGVVMKESILDTAKVSKETEDFKKWLENLKPSDFTRHP
jgi:hypothetical protein